jgi:hypothetical protein
MGVSITGMALLRAASDLLSPLGAAFSQKFPNTGLNTTSILRMLYIRQRYHRKLIELTYSTRKFESFKYMECIYISYVKK